MASARNLPLQIGFFVYQYAKLRMLSFHYDCVDKYLDRENFELMGMDTDSLYMVLSTPSLESAVRPELRQQFFKEYHHWFGYRKKRGTISNFGYRKKRGLSATLAIGKTGTISNFGYRKNGDYQQHWLSATLAIGKNGDYQQLWLSATLAI